MKNDDIAANLSPQQDRAMMDIAAWRRTLTQVFRLDGYAGTGKTTLARLIAAEADDEKVLFAAYTGKAALVMRRKGCPDASTISLIYRPVDIYCCPQHPGVEYLSEDDRCGSCGRAAERRGSPKFILRPDSPLRRVALLVVDEVSMVGEKLALDLLSFGKKVLVIGDPFQLPPVKGCGYFINGTPDIMLTEIHRQAAGNPIIRMSMDVRERRRLANGDYGESRVMPLRGLKDDTADQVLVGCNDSRTHCNFRRRQQLGFADPLPVVGDRLVCLRNDHARGLLNGSLWDVENVAKAGGDIIHLTIKPDGGGAAIKVLTHAAFFDAEARAKLHPNVKRSYSDFDFGYALTVHKAQGSQWDHALMLNESMRFPEYTSRWLYTGITRAAKRITLVRR